MMKKVFFLFACCVLGSYISLAAEIGTGEETKVAEILALLETQQQQDPQTIDRYLEAVNTINKNYEEQLTVALTNNTHSGNTEKLLRDWETIRNFSHHLYTLKERSVQKEIPTSGGTYTFKSWVLMPWVNISRGNKNYFVFPAKKSFIQLN